MVRIKYRYLLVHILDPEPALPKAKTFPAPTDQPLPDLVRFHGPSPEDLTPQLLVRALRDQVQYLYGDYGLGLVASSLVVKYLSPATSTAIVRCSRDHYRIVWAALSFTTHLPKSRSEKQARACVMQVVRVSGTIKKAEEEVIKRARAAILAARSETGQGDVDGFLGLLGEGDGKAAVGMEKGKMAVESDGGYEDEEEEEDEVPMESDDDG